MLTPRKRRKPNRYEPTPIPAKKPKRQQPQTVRVTNANANARARANAKANANANAKANAAALEAKGVYHQMLPFLSFLGLRSIIVYELLSGTVKMPAEFDTSSN